MDQTLPQLRPPRAKVDTPIRRPRLPPPPTAPEEPPKQPLTLSSVRRPTQRTNPAKMRRLLESDRREGGLGHEWFHQAPARDSIEREEEIRRERVWGLATMVSTLAIVATLVLLIVTASG